MSHKKRKSLKVEEIIAEKENIFKVKLKLVSFGWESFFEYLGKDFEGCALDLSSNNLGNFMENQVMALSRALLINQTIMTLHLEDNGLGNGTTENMKILAETLIKNQTITNFYLEGNGL